MTEEQARHMRAWLMAVTDALHAAHAIASRGTDEMGGTDGFASMHELSAAISEFTHRGEAISRARAAANPRR